MALPILYGYHHFYNKMTTMALPEILIVLSSITAQDTLPTGTVLPVINTEKKVDDLTKKTTLPNKPVEKVKEKTAKLLRISRGGWDRN